MVDPARAGAAVAELWRYPVKSMAGQRLAEARLGERGLEGDRRWAFVGADGRFVTARQDGRLLLSRPDQAPGFGYPLRDAPGDNFDSAPLLIVNLASARLFTPDHRRFRANVYLEGLAADRELGWIGHRLRLGEALVAAERLCERCVVITMDPDSGERAPRLLRELARRRRAMMGLYCRVLEPGRVAVGDSCIRL